MIWFILILPRSGCSRCQVVRHQILLIIVKVCITRSIAACICSSVCRLNCETKARFLDLEPAWEDVMHRVTRCLQCFPNGTRQANSHGERELFGVRMLVSKETSLPERHS